MNQILTNFSTILAIVLALPVIEKKYINENQRKYIRNLLLPIDNEYIQAGKVTKDSLVFFNKIFGEKHLSIACFLRSAIFTILFSVICFLLIGVLYSINDLMFMSKTLIFSNNIFYIFISLLASIFIDYVSLWETRYIIGWAKEDMKFLKVTYLLLADIIASLVIFIFLFSLFKSLIDSFLLPNSYSYNQTLISHGRSGGIEVFSENNRILNFILYFISVIKYSILSMIEIVREKFEAYWFSSLFIYGKKLYVLPTSTMWATNHLTSIYIYIGILMWCTGRIISIFNLKKIINKLKMLLFLNNFKLDNNKYPFTIIFLNLMTFYYSICLIVFLYKKV